MKGLTKICLLGTALAASATAMRADTINLSSFGTGTTVAGASNTALVYCGTGSANQCTAGKAASLNAPTYNIGTGGQWTDPIGTSHWVSENPQNFPGGTNVDPTGSYWYSTTFTAASYYSGSITVLADDTTSIYLNGMLITAAAVNNPAPKCTVGTPNCMTATTYNLTGFVNGTNTLYFGVQQLNGSAQGLDFSGVAATPEPSSLMLLGTGLFGAAGAMFRKRRSAL